MKQGKFQLYGSSDLRAHSEMSTLYCFSVLEPVEKVEFVKHLE